MKLLRCKEIIRAVEVVDEPAEHAQTSPSPRLANWPKSSDSG